MLTRPSTNCLSRRILERIDGRTSPAGPLGVVTMNYSVQFSAFKSSGPCIGSSLGAPLSAGVAHRHIAAQLVSSSKPTKRWRTTVRTDNSSLYLSRIPSFTRQNSHRNPLDTVQFRPLHSSSSHRLATVESTVIPNRTTMGSIPDTTPVVRVFIAGGSYAGLSAAVNLLDLGDGLSPRMANDPYTHHPSVPKVKFQITIADERDGYCKHFCSFLANLINLYCVK